MAILIKGDVEMIGHRHRLLAGKGLVEPAFAQIGQMRFAGSAAKLVI